MKALLDFSAKQQLFKHHYLGYAQAMLPVVDKPFAAHLIDQLARDGYQELTIITNDETQEITKKLGDGGFWSISLKYVNIDSPEELSSCIQIKEHPMKEISSDVSLSLLPRHVSEADENTVNEVYCHYMDDNLTALNNTDKFQIPSYQVRPNIFLCEGAKTRAMSDFPLHLGKYAELKSRCIFRGASVIGSGALVESGNILDNTVIMPNTLVGSNLDLSNCLVTPHWIFHRLTGARIDIDDSRILRAA